MKTPMSMQGMMDKVGINIIEHFGVYTAIDNQDNQWQIEANGWDEQSCQKMIKTLSEIHKARYHPPKTRSDHASGIDYFLRNLEGAEK